MVVAAEVCEDEFRGVVSCVKSGIDGSGGTDVVEGIQVAGSDFSFDSRVDFRDCMIGITRYQRSSIIQDKHVISNNDILFIKTGLTYRQTSGSKLLQASAPMSKAGSLKVVPMQDTEVVAKTYIYLE